MARYNPLGPIPSNHELWQTQRLSKMGLTIGVASFLLLVGTTACRAASPQSTFDAITGQFKPCPDSPNCVSTQADPNDSEHYSAPFSYTGSTAEAQQKLLAVIEQLPRTTLVTVEATYLHVEFRSLIFRFVDDVEFYLDDATKTIHFRSASRLGYSDLGVNRKRMEEIRTRFAN
ncbi:MAG: DUF1499 domain-containing protein [Caldilineaceae bacterium]